MNSKKEPRATAPAAGSDESGPNGVAVGIGASWEKTPWLFIARLDFDTRLLQRSISLLDKLLSQYAEAPDEELLERVASESVFLHNTLREVKARIREGNEKGITVVGGMFLSSRDGVEDRDLRRLVHTLQHYGVVRRGEGN